VSDVTNKEADVIFIAFISGITLTFFIGALRFRDTGYTSLSVFTLYKLFS